MFLVDSKEPSGKHDNNTSFFKKVLEKEASLFTNIVLVIQICNE